MPPLSGLSLLACLRQRKRIVPPTDSSVFVCHFSEGVRTLQRRRYSPGVSARVELRRRVILAGLVDDQSLDSIRKRCEPDPDPRIGFTDRQRKHHDVVDPRHDPEGEDLVAAFVAARLSACVFLLPR